ncbi:MAG: hypothetical protein M1833_003426 [Piccolia ochrophora]|nr:MAG: hypothetical protein M1833_003426 [Piccolia ochrophora]
MDRYKEYLAANVLNEARVVTYRSLSRALKVHVTAAKRSVNLTLLPSKTRTDRRVRMLYDFHHQQTAKKSGSVHATYLLCGVRKQQEPQAVNGTHGVEGDDVEMQSSPPFPSSSMPNQDDLGEQIPVTSVVLSREEDLEDIRESFETIFSIHIYSLEPHGTKDVQIISDANREIFSAYAGEDPLEYGQLYGAIRNPNVKRRSGKRPPPSATAPPAPSREKSATSTATKPEKGISRTGAPISGGTQEQKPNSRSTGSGTVPSDRAKASKPSSFKRDSSDIFKSFAKSKPKVKRADTEDSAASEANYAVKKNASQDKDEPMKDASEDEQEEDLVLPASRPRTEMDPDRQSKAQREEQLKKMMDVDDEPMMDSPSGSEAVSPESNTAEVPPVKPESEAEEPPVITSNGRRRGKRKVTKKKTVKDEEGYLVTREEPIWESFSEDEPAPPPKVKAKTGPSKEGKKSTAKPGQGSITSFFGKR